MPGAAPTAQGTLQRSPFVDLAIHFARRRLSGTLVLEDRSIGKSGLTFYGGVPSKIQVPEPTLLLGHYLIRAGVPSAAVHQALHEPDGRPLGERVVQQALFTTERLASTLLTQFSDKLVWLTTLPPETVFAFYDRTDFLAPWPRAIESQDPLPWIWRAARDLDGARLEHVLVGLGQRPLRLHPRAQLARFGFGRDIDVVLEVLRAKPCTYAELRATGLIERTILDRMLYVLVMCQHLDWGEPEAFPLGVTRGRDPLDSTIDPGSRVSPYSRVAPSSHFTSTAPVSSDPPNSVSSRALSSMPASSPDSATPSAVLELAKRLDGLTHYDVLHVPRTAPDESITEAFLTLAKKWHPDRLAKANPALRDAATCVFARMSDAHHTLSNAERRRAYDQTLSTHGEDDHDKVLKVLAAASAFQKAEILARKRDFAGAVALAREARETDPEQLEYAAFVAWAESYLPPYRDTHEYTPLLKVLKNAVMHVPQSVRIHQYYAAVLSRAGRLEKAAQEYRWIVRHDRNNVEAARELRLLKMRLGRDSSGSPPSSARSSRLLSKLLKR